MLGKSKFTDFCLLGREILKMFVFIRHMSCTTLRGKICMFLEVIEYVHKFANQEILV